MSPSKREVLYKSIRFEIIRAKLAFDNFFKIAGTIITETIPEDNPHIQILAFDSYSRWCGHLYECLLALQIVSNESSINEKSFGAEIDKHIQFEAEKAINRRLSLLRSGKDEFSHFTDLELSTTFAKDLRTVRNKCSFHCSLNRVTSSLLQNFINNHHEVAYALYEDTYGWFGGLETEAKMDIGEITNFFKIAKLKILAVQH